MGVLPKPGTKVANALLLVAAKIVLSYSKLPSMIFEVNHFETALSVLDKLFYNYIVG